MSTQSTARALPPGQGRQQSKAAAPIPATCVRLPTTPSLCGFISPSLLNPCLLGAVCPVRAFAALQQQRVPTGQILGPRAKGTGSSPDLTMSNEKS